MKSTPEMVAPEMVDFGDAIRVPKQVQAILIGAASGTDMEQKRINFFLLRVFQQGLEDSSLLTADALEGVFDTCKTIICNAVRDCDPYPFRHMADALEDAAQRERSGIGRLEAIASAFVVLRYKYKNAKVPTSELMHESRREWAESRQNAFASASLPSRKKELIERLMLDFPASNWARDFKKLGITPLLIGRPEGRRAKKLIRRN